jgi:hypothetical protein
MNNDFLVKPTPETEPKPDKDLSDSPEAVSELTVDETEAEEHALGEESVMDQSQADTTEQVKPKKAQKNRRSPKQWFLDLSKKQKIIFIIVLVLVLAGGSIGIWALSRSDTPILTSKKKAATKPKSNTVASRLTGVQISPELNKRGVTGVMIENSEVARPQSGLLDAGVIFEAKAEAGITRFLVLYQEGQPDVIGPVRSVRPHYVDWVQGFDAPLAHAGGSTDGLAKLKADRVRDLDQFANGNYYERVNFRDPPHNLYTSAAKLDALKAAKGFSTSTFKGFLRKSEKKVKTPTAVSIDFSITNATFSVHYDYDKATNSYKRSVGGAPHVDRVTSKQLAPKVVIANVMVNNRGPGSSSNYVTIGSGKCFVFQDGTVTEGTWEKTSSTDQMTFKDARGNDLKLNPGQTWISAVEAPADVSYKP